MLSTSNCFCCYSVTNSVSDSLLLHELQPTSLTCPSLSPRVCSNSCLLSQGCYLTISSFATFSLCLQPFTASGSFPLRIRWPKYWSFSFSIRSSHEYSELISFRTDQFDTLVVQEIQESSPVQYESISSSALSLLYGLALTSIHNYWKNHSFDSTDLCWQSDTSVF